ncbi:MAG: alpha/beta hydrolase, partial [Micromonosporaceae bacterium]
AGSAAGLGTLIAISTQARRELEETLCEALGPHYADELPRRPQPDDLATPWGQLMLPFRMRDPAVRRTGDVAYAPRGRRYCLDIYQRRDSPAGRPVLVQIHGGGWAIGHKAQQGLPLMLHMAARGWVCVAPNYPLSPRARWPEHVVAVKRALAWVKEHIAEYGGDPSYVAVTGGSAGAHLASLLALSAGDPAYQPGFETADTTVQACVPHYGAYDFAAVTGTPATRHRRDFVQRVVVRRSPRRHPELYQAASPLERVHAGAPPFLVIHGRHDSLVPVTEAREFVRRLRAVSGNPVGYAELAGAQHAFDIFPSIRSAHVVRGVERFLECNYARWRAAGRSRLAG